MVRVINGPEDTITFDFRDYRLNLFVVEGVVSRAAFSRYFSLLTDTGYAHTQT
jgi:hypothetical protein